MGGWGEPQPKPLRQTLMKRLLPMLIALALVGCGRGDDNVTTTIALTTGLTGTVTAGPVCPVETDPPDPNCAPRPVADARIVVFVEGGESVGHTLTDVSGRFSFSLPPGSYEIVAEPVDGYMGTPAPVVVLVDDGFTTIDLEYDTGIR